MKKEKKETEGLFVLHFKKQDVIWHGKVVQKKYYSEKNIFHWTTDINEALLFTKKSEAWKFAVEHKLQYDVETEEVK